MEARRAHGGRVLRRFACGGLACASALAIAAIGSFFAGCVATVLIAALGSTIAPTFALLPLGAFYQMPADELIGNWPALLERFAAHPGAVKARAYSEKLMTLAPKRPEAYSTLFAVYRRTRDVEALKGVLARLEKAELDLGDSAREYWDFLNGRSDAKRAGDVRKAAARATEVLNAARGRKDRTFAVAAGRYVQAMLAGYAYADWTTRLGPRRQALLQVARHANVVPLGTLLASEEIDDPLLDGHAKSTEHVSGQLKTLDSEGMATLLPRGMHSRRSDMEATIVRTRNRGESLLAAVALSCGAKACNMASIAFHVPSRCHRRNNPYTVSHGPYAGGTSRHGVPARIRHRIPSINCRLLHFGGRPDFFPLGSNNSHTAHWTSVRSARPATATLATRSPEHWFVLVDKPPTGDLTHLDHRHAAITAGQAFETRSRR